MNIVGKIIEVKDEKNKYEMYMKRISSHLIYCKKCQHLTKSEKDKIKALKILEYFEINKSPYEIYNEYLQGYSVIDLGEKYNVDYGIFYKVFNKLNLKLRTSKEFSGLAQKKREKTCLEKYR